MGQLTITAKIQIVAAETDKVLLDELLSRLWQFLELDGFIVVGMNR